MSSQDVWSHPADVEKIRNQFLIIEDYRDFIGWLFDKHVEWMSESDAWELFRKSKEQQP